MADLIAGNGKLVFLDDNGDSAGDMVGGYPPLVYYKARKTEEQVLADNVSEWVSFQTTDFDTHTGRKNSYYYEIQQDGLYRISAQISMEATYSRDFIIGLMLSTDSSAVSGEATALGTWTAIDTTGYRGRGPDGSADAADLQNLTLMLNSTHSLSVGNRLAIRAYVNTVPDGAYVRIHRSAGSITSSCDFFRAGYITWFELSKVGSTPS